MRGMEGKRVKKCYEENAKIYGVKWDGRNYDKENWVSDNDVNRFLSIGNSLLYGICQAAIIAFGMSPGLGFIHNGGSRSFVFDVADLYKEKIIIPTAFKTVGDHGVDEDILTSCRELLIQSNFMKKLAADISMLFKFNDISAKIPVDVGLWNLNDCVELGINYSREVN